MLTYLLSSWKILSFIIIMLLQNTLMSLFQNYPLGLWHFSSKLLKVGGLRILKVASVLDRKPCTQLPVWALRSSKAIAPSRARITPYGNISKVSSLVFFLLACLDWEYKVSSLKWHCLTLQIPCLWQMLDKYIFNE